MAQYSISLLATGNDAHTAGSVPWMAPEFFNEGGSGATQATDMWAFGMTLYVSKFEGGTFLYLSGS